MPNFANAMNRRKPVKRPRILRIHGHSTGFYTKVIFAKMRLPLPLLTSPFFLFGSLDELNRAIGNIDEVERTEILRLHAIGLPPVSSRNTLATMFGINPDMIWSFENRSKVHYRSFKIKKGKNGGFRSIVAPRVALKVIQKWLSYHLSRLFRSPDHVYGFVNGRSHIDAAKIHCNAKWIFSVDIKNFFETTSSFVVIRALENIGFNIDSAKMIARLSCYEGFLAQGSPCSPILSNMCFEVVDSDLLRLAAKYEVRMTRYADDIVFSGIKNFPEDLKNDVLELFVQNFWSLSTEKICFATSPQRLKVHGLLVHSECIRLTKGYRNKIRAYKYMLDKNKIIEKDFSKIYGHLKYADYVENKIK